MSSESWKKPSDVLTVHRRRKSASQRRIVAEAAKRTNVIYKSPVKSVKRKNPFNKENNDNNPSKRQHSDNLCNQASNSDISGCPSEDVNSSLFSLLDSVDKVTQDQAVEEIKIDPQEHETNIHQETQDSKESNQTSTVRPAQIEDKQSEEYTSEILLDWALKTKLRIVSPLPLNWCVQLKSADEAAGVKHFSENTIYSEHLKSNVSDPALFHSSCQYWIHPNLPWLQLFPRHTDNEAKSSLVASPLLQDDIHKHLKAEWEQSFTSVYQQLRSRHCPYFYVCSHQLTVLFYMFGEKPCDVIVMVTPTTRGFRESLENEGITYKLPVVKKGSGSKSGATNSELEHEEIADGEINREIAEEDDVDLLGSDEAASGWLESMGIDTKMFPSLDPTKVKLQREGFKVIDHRPESLVLIEGGEVQSFFNFLLNCSTLTAMSGVQAGLPPTILSPNAFKGATLKCLKVRHTVAKQVGSEKSEHILEVSGPILPTNCYQLVKTLHKTQDSQFNIVLNNLETSVPLNILQGELSVRCNWELETERGDGSSVESSVSVIDKTDGEVTGQTNKEIVLRDQIISVKEIMSTRNGFKCI